MADPTEIVNVRYMVNDVQESVDWYAGHFGFSVVISSPAFGSVERGRLRLLLSGKASSAGRPMPDGRQPEPGGWNRFQFIVDDIAAEVERLRGRGVTFRNDVVTGPGGAQILVEDPSGNIVEVFQPAAAFQAAR
jgi:catechol 2,3-dioxygenase-like lactoylglutathione lyase family enzyme